MQTRRQRAKLPPAAAVPPPVADQPVTHPTDPSTSKPSTDPPAPSQATPPSKQKKRKRKGPLTEAEAQIFTQPEHRDFFYAKECRNLRCELELDGEVLQLFGMRQLFEQAQWSALLRLKGDYYPRLLVEFYSNIENKAQKKPTEIVSYVRGCRIVLNEDILNDHLNLPRNGRRIDLYKTQLQGGGTWDVHAAYHRYGVIPTGPYGHRHLLSRNLDAFNRTLVTFFSHNIIPHAGRNSQFRAKDLFLLDVLLNHVPELCPISVSYLMLQSIFSAVHHRNTDKYFVFPGLLTQLLIQQGVDVSTFQKVTPDADGILTKAQYFAWEEEHRGIPVPPPPTPLEDRLATLEEAVRELNDGQQTLRAEIAAHHSAVMAKLTELLPSPPSLP